MNEIISDDVVSEIIAQINEKINIPFLSEKQEQYLFEFVLKSLLEVILKSKKP